MNGSSLIHSGPGRPRRWFRVEDLHPELNPFVTKLGRMPKQQELLKAQRSELMAAIAKFGGWETVAIALGYNYTARRSWPDIESLRTDLKAIMGDQDIMPRPRTLELARRFDLTNAIMGLGGYSAVAKALGYRTTRRKWPTIEKLQHLLEPVVVSLGHMPSRNELKKQGLESLTAPIAKFGGFEKVALALGYPINKKGFISDLEKRSALWLLPFGLYHQSAVKRRLRLEGHTFDFSNRALGLVLEINGCYWHQHQFIKLSCPIGPNVSPGPRTTGLERDQFVRQIADRHGLSLIELWECEQAKWPTQVQSWLEKIAATKRISTRQKGDSPNPTDVRRSNRQTAESPA